MAMVGHYNTACLRVQNDEESRGSQKQEHLCHAVNKQREVTQEVRITAEKFSSL